MKGDSEDRRESKKEEQRGHKGSSEGRRKVCMEK